MARIRVSVLRPVTLEVEGVPRPLTPLTSRLLIRLVAAGGEPVPARVLRRDVWAVPPSFPVHTVRDRNEVQKRVHELRRALDPDGTGEGDRVLRTERIPTPQGSESAYRLVLTPDQLDSARFVELVNEALRASPVPAARMLAEAIALFQGARPLAEVADEEFARGLARRLTGLHQTARRELVRIHLELGDHAKALPLLQDLATEQPDDAGTAEMLAAVREKLRGGPHGAILRHELPGLHTTVTVVVGDLFDQHGANLVVGFSDTFDVATERDVVISGESVQGQLVARVFAADPKALDRELKRELRNVTPLGVESAKDKPRGKRVRYPVGTVVPIPAGGRRIFATAYSRLDNDLVARSTEEDLRLSLDRLWDAAARHGLDKPLAIPLVGSGLARIVGVRRGTLMRMIAESYIRASRRNPPRVAPELRIVLLPTEVERSDLGALEAYLEVAGRQVD